MSSFTFRPPSFFNLPADQLAIELDRSLPRLYDAHSTLLGIAIQAPALNGAFSVQSGTAVVTGSLLNIQTGLATVEQVVVSINNGAVATNATTTARPSPGLAGAIDIFVWVPTSSGVNTPIASTVATTVHWWSSGTNSLNTASSS